MLAAPALSGRASRSMALPEVGLSVLRFLARSGAVAVAWDESGDARAAARGVSPNLPLEDFATLDLSGVDGIIVSPGVPLNRHPLAARARAAGVPILGDLELFQMARAKLPPHKVVGITGTNGKSTTTALLHHLLAAAGMVARLGGNIGLPILDQAPLPAGGVYVLELSSFQIDLCTSLACDVAIYTNLTPDHLDRYDGLSGYAAAKERLFAMQPPGGQAVIATDDDWTRGAAARLPAGIRLTRVSAADIAAHDQARWPALQGPHNAQNVACAAGAARLLGVGEQALEAGLRSFPGLAHRMEIVSEIGGVRYVNDSKATNSDERCAGPAGLSGIHWILGGQAKSPDLDACLPHLGHVKAAYVIGEAAPMFAGILSAAVACRGGRDAGPGGFCSSRGAPCMETRSCCLRHAPRSTSSAISKARGAAFRDAVRRIAA
jgi:UDP-N-acetylmuramoylalanine--D-glutamate ligase